MVVQNDSMVIVKVSQHAGGGDDGERGIAFSPDAFFTNG
jgi:hypothetical protein